MTSEPLTTREVAQRLGVKPETVYAYVSRGLLTSSRDPAGRGSVFSAAEVDRLAARTGEGRRPTGVVETVASRISLLADDELYFRGYPARDLAASRSLEEVAGLLWHGELGGADGPNGGPDAGSDGAGGVVGPVRFTADPSTVAQVRAVLAALPAQARLTDRLRVGVATLAATDPWRFDLSPAAVTRSAAALVRALVEAVSPPGPEDATVAELLWPVLTDAPARTDVLDVALVLLADHGLAVSTLTARVAASGRAHVYAVVSAGLGALDGPFHGTASTAAHRFLTDATPDPAGALAARLQAGERIPGFGHTVYRRRDPRAEVLLDLVRGTRVAAVVDELAGHLAERTGQFPNVDLALAAVMHAHDMRSDAGEAVFAVARTVGWVAHALEEYTEPGLRFRAPGTYTGPAPRAVPPR